MEILTEKSKFLLPTLFGHSCHCKKDISKISFDLNKAHINDSWRVKELNIFVKKGLKIFYLFFLIPKIYEKIYIYIREKNVPRSSRLLYAFLDCPSHHLSCVKISAARSCAKKRYLEMKKTQIMLKSNDVSNLGFLVLEISNF